MTGEYLNPYKPGDEVIIMAGLYDEHGLPIDVEPKKYVVLEVYDDISISASQVREDGKLHMPGTIFLSQVVAPTGNKWTMEETNSAFIWNQPNK